MRRRLLAVVVALAVVVGAAACASEGDGTSAGSGGPATTAPSAPSTTLVTAAARPVAFTTWDETLVDPSRPTPAGAETPAAPDRTLVTTVRLPEGDGPSPLVVFSHGLFGHPRKFSELLDAWAAAGYVVVAPAFPLTNADVPGAARNAGDLVAQPGDVSFVLDEVLAADEDPSSPLHGRIDRERIGAAGLSLGGATTYAVVFHDCCRDERFSAAMVLAGAMLPAFDGDFELDGHVPLLIVHGDADPALRYDLAVQAWVAAAPPVWFVTLLGGSHAPPFEDDPTPYDEAVEAMTTAWWDTTLGSDPAATAAFEAAAVVPGFSVLEQRLP